MLFLKKHPPTCFYTGMPKLFLMFFFRFYHHWGKLVFLLKWRCVYLVVFAVILMDANKEHSGIFPLPSCLTFHLCFIPESGHSLALSTISIIKQCVIRPGCFVALCLEQSWLMRVNLAEEVTQTKEWIGTVKWNHWKQTLIIPIFFNSLLKN